ncbi:hypothetical protein INQ51_06185 [Maribellus sp. CM-23]|uniref:hypothetical protein n=1 Tax=Maribellus sp. CM-23 TaxID=2781026 RepID=UPI001F3BF853|nr:hypothetical protein [Maribellus sp. CM-23]MCE4563894.1 hypothetical protein [Maribellus sp. CM-23]
MKISFLIGVFWWLPFLVAGQLLPGFQKSASFNEQQMVLEGAPPNTRILINAPLDGLGKRDQVLLIFYALPNGNTIEQTFGKTIKEGDDWHFNIQHIGAQTRFLRGVVAQKTIVVACLETTCKSWPLWKKNNPDYLNDTKNIVERITAMFSAWNPQLVLNGHSGGGRFIFSYLEAVKVIPDNVKRIAFLDSDYGYEDSIHGPQLTNWLKAGKDRFLTVLAYNDSVVVYNGKQLVSPTGGTWYRSRMMKKYLARSFQFSEEGNDSLLWSRSPGNKIEFILKTNPEGKIFHTVQVERNGFIHSILSGTKQEQKGYIYFGERAYENYISDSITLPIRQLNIPPRKTDAEPGSVFMKRIENLPLEEREEEICKALADGNVPVFLRRTISLKAAFADAEGVVHKVEYQIMPDYLAVGSDDDYCRIPMNPRTAQRLATLFGASLITSKISDGIYEKAELKLEPFPYKPVGNANETVQKFVDHNSQIERQMSEAGGTRWQLVAGIKKDVILSERIAQQPDKVVIYGWHKSDGKPIQPVYSGHVYWYVDYSHGIRLMNNQVLLDGKPALLSDILKDPVLFKVFSNEDAPMSQTVYLSQ